MDDTEEAVVTYHSMDPEVKFDNETGTPFYQTKCGLKIDGLGITDNPDDLNCTGCQNA